MNSLLINEKFVLFQLISQVLYNLAINHIFYLFRTDRLAFCVTNIIRIVLQFTNFYTDFFLKLLYFW